MQQSKSRVRFESEQGSRARPPPAIGQAECIERSKGTELSLGNMAILIFI
jgi:hypothetical protein